MATALGTAPRTRPRHGPTEADSALWHAYTTRAHVAPMPGKALPALPPAPALPTAILPTPTGTATPTVLRPPALVAASRGAELQVGAPPPGLDGKRWAALRRGRTRPERTLDLHGRRAQEAHGAVRRFLAEAVADGIRCVAIVTGKGSTQEGGVLRRELPHWLNAPELRHLLLGAAHPHAANPGAVHLLLRKRSDERSAIRRDALNRTAHATDERSAARRDALNRTAQATDERSAARRDALNRTAQATVGPGVTRRDAKDRPAQDAGTQGNGGRAPPGTIPRAAPPAAEEPAATWFAALKGVIRSRAGRR